MSRDNNNNNNRPPIIARKSLIIPNCNSDSNRYNLKTNNGSNSCVCNSKNNITWTLPRIICRIQIILDWIVFLNYD